MPTPPCMLFKPFACKASIKSAAPVSDTSCVTKKNSFKKSPNAYVYAFQNQDTPLELYIQAQLNNKVRYFNMRI